MDSQAGVDEALAGGSHVQPPRRLGAAVPPATAAYTITEHDDKWRHAALAMAGHGYLREAAQATFACPLLRHDPELLGQFARLVDRNGDTLLMRASLFGFPVRIKELLDACFTPATRAALLEARDAHGSTPLMYAGDGPTAQCLLDAGADLRAVDAAQAGAIHIAARQGSSALEVLLAALGSDEERRMVVNRAALKGVTPLMDASNAACVRLLLVAGASLLAVDNDNDDAFVYCCGHSVLSELLDALGSDKARRKRVLLPSASGLTLLMRAVDGESVRLLMEAGANVRAVDSTKKDAFEHAVAHSRPSALGVLLDALGSPYERRQRATRVHGASARTLLMEAFDPACAQLLLSAGADLHAVDTAQKDAIAHAVELGRPAVLEGLLAALASPQARRQRVNRVDAAGRTLLMQAVNGRCAQSLLNAGANVWASDAKQQDAFGCAVDSGRSAVLAVLLEKLPESRLHAATCVDALGRTLLMRAKNKELARLLLDAGSDVRAVDEHGRDAFVHGALRPGVLHVLLAALGSDAERQRTVVRADLIALGLIPAHFL